MAHTDEEGFNNSYNVAYNKCNGKFFALCLATASGVLSRRLTMVMRIRTKAQKWTGEFYEPCLREGFKCPNVHTELHER
jgi:hypothetical protein